MNEDEKVIAESELAQKKSEQVVKKGEKNSKEPETVDGRPIVHVKVYSPFKIYYDGQAFSISAENDTGPFDILPKHHNFMTLLSPCELYIDAPGGEQRIKITRGVMHVKADLVTIFLDV